MIRHAKYIDNLRIIELVKEMHEKSVYAGKVTMDEQRLKNIIVTAMQTYDKNNHACVIVSETDGVVEGFIIGMLDRIYGISKEFYATDLFFYASDRAKNTTAISLLKAFLMWAEKADNVFEIRLGITGTIGGWEKLARLYDKLGFTQDGVMMTKEIMK